MSPENNLQTNPGETEQQELKGKWSILYYVLLIVVILSLTTIGAIIDMEVLHTEKVAIVAGFIIGISLKGVIKLLVIKFSQKNTENEK